VQYRQLLGALLGVLVIGAPFHAVAVDGVIEINQACATGPGCFSGDPAGFPVTINQTGSYRLTGNLTVPANMTAISINVPHVTLDLGGFEVKGPNSCSGTPVASCSTTDGNAGILSNNYGTVVRNGNVIGMGGSCISLGDSAMVERTSVYFCGRNGIDVDAIGRVLENSSGYNFRDGIVTLIGTSVENNDVRYNRLDGIDAPGLVSRNVAYDNGVQISGGVSLGDNLCNGALC
jgi:hypothetical protein